MHSKQKLGCCFSAISKKRAKITKNKQSLCSTRHNYRLSISDSISLSWMPQNPSQIQTLNLLPITMSSKPYFRQLSVVTLSPFLFPFMASTFILNQPFEMNFHRFKSFICFCWMVNSRVLIRELGNEVLIFSSTQVMAGIFIYLLKTKLYCVFLFSENVCC